MGRKKKKVDGRVNNGGARPNAGVTSKHNGEIKISRTVRIYPSHLEAIAALGMTLQKYVDGSVSSLTPPVQP